MIALKMKHKSGKEDINLNKVGKVQNKNKLLFIFIFTIPSGEESTKLERKKENSISKKCNTLVFRFTMCHCLF